MSSSHNSSLETKVNAKAICEEFTKAYTRPALELFKQFELGQDCALDFISDRFFVPKTWVPEEDKFEQKGMVRPFEKEALAYIKNLNEKYTQNPALLTNRQVILLSSAYYMGLGVEKNDLIAYRLLENLPKNCSPAQFYILAKSFPEKIEDYIIGETAEQLIYEYISSTSEESNYYKLGCYKILVESFMAQLQGAKIQINLTESKQINKQIKLLEEKISNLEKEMLPILLKSANETVIATFMLGGAYLVGLFGLEKNNIKAVEYLTNAAKQGISEALILLYELTNDEFFLETAAIHGQAEAIMRLAAKEMEEVGSAAGYAKFQEQLKQKSNKSEALVSIALYDNNPAEVALSYYKLARRAFYNINERININESKILEDVERATDISKTQLTLSPTKRDQQMNYRLAYAFRDAKHPQLKRLMKEFIQSDSEGFLAISKIDPWNEVKKLIDKPKVKPLENKIKADIQKIFADIHASAPDLGMNLVKLIFSYDARYEGQLSLYSQMNLNTLFNKPSSSDHKLERKESSKNQKASCIIS